MRAWARRCLTVDGRPSRAKNRRKVMGSPNFPGRNASIECGRPRRLRAATWNRDLLESNRPAGDLKSISRDFDTGAWGNSNTR